jgi:hypothetical protein
MNMQESRDFGILGGVEKSELGNGVEDVGHTEIWHKAEIGGGELMNIGWD